MDAGSTGGTRIGAVKAPNTKHQNQDPNTKHQTPKKLQTLSANYQCGFGARSGSQINVPWKLEIGICLVFGVWLWFLVFCFQPPPAFLIAHHAVAHRHPARAVLADAAYSGPGVEPAHGLVELPGGLAAWGRRGRREIHPARSGRDLSLRRRHVLERRIRR